MVDAVLDPVACLEQRLSRVEFALTGATASSPVKVPGNGSVSHQVQQMEHRLAELSRHSSTAAELLKIYDKAPELLQPHEQEQASTPAELSRKKTVVLAAGPSLLQLRSQLDTLQAQQIPNASGLVELIESRPKLDAVLLKHEYQMRQICLLRDQSAALLGRWYQDGVLSDGQYWADIEERLKGIELAITRREKAETRAQQEV